MKKTTFLALLFILLTELGASAFSASSAAGTTGSTAAVAVVGSHLIYASDVVVPNDSTAEVFTFREARLPTNSASDQATLTEIKHEQATGHLRVKIERLVTDDLLAKYNATITQAFKLSENQRVASADRTNHVYREMLPEIHEHLAASYALEAIYAKGMPESEAYKKYCEKYMTEETWTNVYLGRMRTPKAWLGLRKQASALLNVSESQFIANVGLPMMLVKRDKLKQICSQLLSGSDPTYALNEAIVNNAASSNDARLKAQQYIDAAGETWWRMQLAGEHIKILDPSFSSLDKVFNLNQP